MTIAIIDVERATPIDAVDFASGQVVTSKVAVSPLPGLIFCPKLQSEPSKFVVLAIIVSIVLPYQKCNHPT
jgi:hypothetical protein